MKKLFTDNEYQLAKANDKLPCECYQCGETFLKIKKEITRGLKGLRPNIGKFCSNSCSAKFQRPNAPLEVECKNCSNKFHKPQRDIKKSINNFCSRSCNASYQNKNKTYGIRRSKLEAFIEEQLTQLYPNLEFHFNRKDTIGSELDIYCPCLNIAFELNGIFHYEPIFGTQKLEQTQNNDNNKFKSCIEHKIDLCVIDTSQQKRFTEKSSQKYVNIITNIINERSLTS